MSSFYDDASLVVIPSGYKTSKVYAEKPTDGSGDLAFTRTGDTATRVNSAGLIEKVRTNLVTFSEDFANAAWTKNNATVTSNTQANPVNGAVTADTITATASVGYVNSAAIALSAIPYTISMYAKKSNVDWVSIEVSDGVANSAKSWYNIANGTLGTTGGTYTITGRTITSAGNGWYRCTLTFNVTAATNYSFVPFFVASDGALSVNGNAGFAFGTQVEATDFGATDYIPTTTAAVSVGPVANVPRLDYLGSTCPRLLLEPQRTNLVTYSEQFNNAAWTKQEVTVTANAAISPDGYTNADNIVPTAVSGTHQIFSGALVSSSQCAMSVYAKANGYTTLQILDRASGSNGALFNLANGTVTNTGSGVGTITAVGNGWYRCSAVATTTGVRIYIPSSNGTFVGDGTSGVLLWGAQVEAGAYATSYIPTLAASATRGAEKVAKTGISSLIGQTEGTIYFEINKTARTDSEYRFNLSDGSSDNWIFLGIEASNVPRFYVRAAASTGVDFSGSALSSGTHKVAAAYKQNDFVLYVDGVQVGSDTSGNVGATSQLHFGGNYIDQVAETDSRTAQALLFKTRLSNAALAELTTL